MQCQRYHRKYQTHWITIRDYGNDENDCKAQGKEVAVHGKADKHKEKQANMNEGQTMVENV